MLLAVDVGNTHTVFGLFEEESVRADWRIATAPARNSGTRARIMLTWYDAAAAGSAGRTATNAAMMTPPQRIVREA